MTEYDYFISHASEDKQQVAEPLAIALENLGAKIWLDKFELTIGDSLRESIDMGLQCARQGIAILSPAYFEKYWTKKELNSLFSKASLTGKVILPIRHGISAEEVSKRSLLLSDLFSLSTEDYTIDELAKLILSSNRYIEE